MLFLSAVIGWPVATLVQRKKGILIQPPSPMAKLARWAAGFAAALAAILIIAIYVILQNQSWVFSIPPGVSLVFIIPYIVIFLGIITIVMMVLAWKNKYWSIWGRVHYSLVALALSFFTWFVWFWNLVGFDIYG